MAVCPTRLVSYRLNEHNNVVLFDMENKSLGSIPEVYVRDTINTLVRHQVRAIRPGALLNKSIPHIAELIDALITRVAMETGT